MKSLLHRQALATIGKHEMVRAGDSVAVAVSGGADSVALLRLLQELRNDLGISLCVVHLNHQLRGNDSDRDEQFVSELAKAAGLEFHSARIDVAGEAKRHGWNLEDAARRARYEFFANILREGRATKVATAHTLDDQAETVLARLIRGSGLTGLAAIRPKRGTVIRPLLEIRRQELRDYLRENEQDWREDATNADTQRLRARLRHRLLPVLQNDFSKAIVARLAGIAELARADDDFWQALVEDRFRSAATRQKGKLAISTLDLLKPLTFSSATSQNDRTLLALTRRLVRRIYAEVAGGAGEISASHVKEIVWLAKNGSSGRRLELSGGVAVEREFDRLIFSRKAASRTIARNDESTGAVRRYEYEIALPESGSASIHVLELERCFRLKLIDWPMRERETRREGRILDLEQLRLPLVLRNWRPGDAYRPSGRRDERKLKRMFTARRIGAGKRALWPVLTSGDRVVWADRMPVAAEFSATNRTRVGLEILEDETK